MEANELMIGDWVMDGDVAARVTSLTCDGIIETTLRISNVEVAEPIPLTAEILLKNGFADISDHTLKGAEVYRLSIEQNYYDYTITIKLRDWFRLTSFDEREYTLCQINWGFKYVHELQHALRLCGIDKEIML